MPYFGPPFTPKLTKPAAVNTSEAMMKGHLYPRKSKFVFLNNSIYHCPPVFGPNGAIVADTAPYLLVPEFFEFARIWQPRPNGGCEF